MKKKTMKGKTMRRKKAAAGFFASWLLIAQSLGQTFPVSGEMAGKEPNPEDKVILVEEETNWKEASEDFTWELDPEDHLNLWVVDEILSRHSVSEERTTEDDEDPEENENSGTGDHSEAEEKSETEEDSETVENSETEAGTEAEERSEKAEESEAEESETKEISERAEESETEENSEIEEDSKAEENSEIEEDSKAEATFEKAEDSEAEANFEIEEDSQTAENSEIEESSKAEAKSERSTNSNIEVSSATEEALKMQEELETNAVSKPESMPSMPTPLASGTSLRASEAVAHDPDEIQKLVLTRVFSYWKKDLYLQPLYRDEAHVNSGGMTSTTLALHRLGNISDGYPYLNHYIWAYCIEPNVGSNSWTQYQNTAQDAVQLMLKIEKEAPSIYYGMIRAIAYTEYRAAQLPAGEAAAFRCACQTAVWQLLCGMVDGKSGKRILKTEEGFVADQLYDNISQGALALYDNYREVNIASFTGTQVLEKLEEIYTYLGEYEKIPSFMAPSGQEAEEKTVTMTYEKGQYVAEVTDEQGVLAQYLGTKGTLADSSIRYERKENKVVFTADQVPEKTIKINKKTEPAAKTPAYFVYGSFEGSDRKQSLLGECNPDPISAWIRFVPARKQTGIIKIAEEAFCPEGIRNNPNYDMEAAVFGIYDEQNVLREKITLTTDVSAIWKQEDSSGINAALRKALEDAGSNGQSQNTLACGVSAETYEVGEKLILKELVVPRGFQKAPNQRLTVSAIDEKNVWKVAEDPILDPLDLKFFKKASDEIRIPSSFLDDAEFTVRFYPEEAGPKAEKPVGECTWTGVFATSQGGKLLLYKEYCLSGLDTFVGTINPLTGDLIFPFGWIEILETKAPEGFQLNSNSIWIRLGQDQTQTRIPDQELIRETEEGIDFINREKTWGRIQGIKTDGTGPLAGAQMMICREDGQPLTANGRGDADFTSVIFSGEDGTFSWDGLSFGKYLIKEIKAPAGYDLSEEAQEGYLVELTPDLILEGELVITLDPIVNQEKKVSIRIFKTLEQNEEYCSLESADWEQIRFRITGVTETGESVERIVSMAEAQKVERVEIETSEEGYFSDQRILLVDDLPRGTYTVCEIADEALDGYEIPKEQVADFLSEENVTLEKEVYFENRYRRYDLRILKRSADTGENLEGSTFRLEVKDYKMDWEEFQDDQTEWMEDEKGRYQWKVIDEKMCIDASEGIRFENLLKGDYRIFETRSPYPYQLLIQNVLLHLPFPDDEENEITLILQDRAILHPVESGGKGGHPVLFFWLGIAMMGAAFFLIPQLKMTEGDDTGKKRVHKVNL